MPRRTVAALGALSGVRWGGRRYDVVAFEGCIALVPSARGRSTASLLALSSGQLGTLDGGARIVRDVEVSDVAVAHDRLGGRARLALERGGELTLTWSSWGNRRADGEALLSAAFPRKAEQATVRWAPRILRAAAAALAAAAVVAGLVLGAGALLGGSGPRAAPPPPVAATPPAVESAHAELGAACPPWRAVTAGLARGQRPDPLALRPVLTAMRPHLDAAAGLVASYAPARDQLAVLQDYAARDAASALKESSARLEFAREAVDGACATVP